MRDDRRSIPFNWCQSNRVMGEGQGSHPRIRDGVGEVVGDGCLSLDVGTRALYIGMRPRKLHKNWKQMIQFYG